MKIVGSRKTNLLRSVSLVVLFVVGSGLAAKALEVESKLDISTPDALNRALSAIDYCRTRSCSPEFKLALEGANRGDPTQENRIGEMFHFGEGIPVDFKEAKIWYMRASRHGNSEAPNHLGRLYTNGEGVPIDNNEACRWYLISKARGNEAGVHNAATCYERETKIVASTPVGQFFKNAASVTMKYKDIGLRDAFKQILKYSDYVYILTNKVSNAETVTLDVKEAAAYEVFNFLIEDSGLKYDLDTEGRIVVGL